MALLLLIETATDVCSVAVSHNGILLAQVQTAQANDHAALLTLSIESCLRQAGVALADLDAVAVSRGPGSYTSLRVGVAAAKGLCYALDKPLIAVDTLLALAAAAQAALPAEEAAHACYLPMIDARRREVWTALYDAALRPLLPAQPLILENNLLDRFVGQADAGGENRVYVFSGNGAEKAINVPMEKKAVFSTVKSCSAAHMTHAAEINFQNNDFEDIAYFEPFYMKPPAVTTPRPGLF